MVPGNHIAPCPALSRSLLFRIADQWKADTGEDPFPRFVGVPRDHLAPWFSTGVILLWGDIWHRLETLWVVITWGGGAPGI